jgi:NAD(P)-dependent dehydrogenase (short-subunit alcohol dehydrogenase family)
MIKTAIVTGSAGGIGQAIVKNLQKNGWRVVGLDLVPTDSCDQSITVDLANEEDRNKASAQIHEPESIAAVIHVAAIQDHGGVGELSASAWDRALQVNVVALDHIVGTFRGPLKANSGSVVAVSSVHSVSTTPGIVSYTATKGALESWVRSAALEFGASITVNAVRPGAIDSAKLQQGFSRWGDLAKEKLRNLMDRTPVGRLGNVEEVAGICSFLVSENARFITGSCITIDGGALARLGTE